jgi:hypothetical protein
MTVTPTMQDIIVSGQRFQVSLASETDTAATVRLFVDDEAEPRKWSLAPGAASSAAQSIIVLSGGHSIDVVGWGTGTSTVTVAVESGGTTEKDTKPL